MKTAAAVLQEMAVKLGLTPEYEFIAQSGPHHQSTFEYRCTLLDQSTTVSARSKKEAKQEAATALLVKLSRAGHSVPPPWGLGMGAQMGGLGPGGKIGGMGIGGLAAGGQMGDQDAGAQMCSPGAAPDPHSYVALLKEYCEEYKIPAPEYSLIGDSGPPHLRSFTIRATVGAHSRDSTALTKKAARQMAAESIYKYLRGCLRSTQDFVELDALARSIDKKMGRFKEQRKEVPWRPPLSQNISEYHYGLIIQFEEHKRAAALEALRSTANAGQLSEVQLECAASELGLELQWKEMPSKLEKPIIAVELPTTSPALVLFGYDRNDAAANMIDYLYMCLPNAKSALISGVH